MRASAYRAMIVAAVLAATIATFAAPAVAAHPTTTGPRRSVVADDPPSNDNFADRQALSGAHGSVTADTTEATAEPGEPAHAGSAAAASVWYRYTPAKTASVEFDTCGSDFDTVLAVYTGTVLTALTPVASNDDSNNDGCEDQSLVTFTATAGVAYSIAVDGYAGDTGDAVLEWGPAPVPPANDMFANAQIISGASGSASGSNAAATTEPGEPQHDGAPTGHSVWFRYTPTAAGTLTLSSCASNFDTVIAVYTGTTISTLTSVGANDDYCGIQSQLSVGVAKGVPLSIALAGYSTDAGHYVLNWSFGPGIVPTAPTLTGASTGDGWAVVSWTPPTSTGSSPITSYTVGATTGAPSVTVPAGATSAVLTGLVDGVSYPFTVTATNAAGTGVQAAPADLVRPSAGAVSVTTTYNAADNARLLADAAYYNATPADAQRISVGVIAYLAGLAHSSGMTPVAPSPSSGPNSYTTPWATTDQSALVTVMNQYGLNASQAQYFSVVLVGYLLSLTGH